ncbi:MAG: hypothetical protein GY859_36645 [Desulfobacterales bacterium]|nr:hypothetical protein [Desulfobacterales bacterium]
MAHGGALITLFLAPKAESTDGGEASSPGESQGARIGRGRREHRPR